MHARCHFLPMPPQLLGHACHPPGPPCPADEGCYAGGTFLFDFRVPESYPADPPKVRALTQVRFAVFMAARKPTSILSQRRAAAKGS